VKPKDLEARITAALRKVSDTRLVLARVRSRSSPKIRHSIQLGSDHVVFCSCDGWRWSKKTPKTCHHLETFKAAVRPQEF
jgi:hypothetical protein